MFKQLVSCNMNQTIIIASYDLYSMREVKFNGRKYFYDMDNLR